jgi:uncharacterized phage protein gp47/JayE
VDWKTLIGHKDRDTLLAGALSELKASGSKITNLNAGGVFRTLAELSMQGAADLYDLLTAVVPQGFASDATGQWLDAKCAEVGIARKPATKTEGLVVFGRAAAGSSVVVPAGAIGQTASGLDPELRFVVTEETVIPAAELEYPVPVRAEFAGADYNVGAGLIATLVTYIYGVDYVRNDADWITTEGADEETDDSLRARYFLRWLEIAQPGNKDSYVFWAMSVAGVTSVTVDDAQPRGQGTVDVIIYGSGAPSQALIDAVTEYIEDRRPLCANVLVKAPTELLTNVAVVITVHPTYGDAAAIAATATSYIRALFGLEDVAGIEPLGIGESLYRARLIALVMSIPNVLSVTVSAPAADVLAAVDELVVLDALEVTTA